MIRRRFADFPSRQVHFRYAGTGGVPLLMLHCGPGSAKQLESLIAAVSVSRYVLAPDMPGNGDSSPLAMRSPTIADYALATLAFLDNLGLDAIDIYGAHTGALIAVEMAILAPSRVRRLVLDGIPLFSSEERRELLDCYAPQITPDLFGAHMRWAFLFCRDQCLFWPWYRRSPKNSRKSGLPSADDLHNWVVEVLKAIDTYHLAYQAVFSYRASERLKMVRQPTLILSATSDTLASHSMNAADFVANSKIAAITIDEEIDPHLDICRHIQEFLDGRS